MQLDGEERLAVMELSENLLNLGVLTEQNLRDYVESYNRGKPGNEKIGKNLFSGA